MNITVEIRTINTDENQPLLATASVVMDGNCVMHNVGLVRANNKIFLSFPSRRRRNGRWYNVCHPIKAEFRDEMQAAFIEAYRGYLAERGLSEPEGLDETERGA